MEQQNETKQTYQTGRTAPPKSHQGIIAFLLVLVIFLCGVSTALGLLNIHLFRKLQEQPSEQDNALSFSRSEYEQTLPQSDPVCFAPLGLSGEAVSAFWQQYLSLPGGIYITDVTANAAAADLRPGDILLQLENSPTDSVQALTALLDACKPGQDVTLRIYRDGQELTLVIPIQ